MLPKFIERQFIFFLAFVFVVLAIIGGVRAYSPIPFWDMWDGYLGFYNLLSEGDWSVWWSQHNEHRIVLSRILFWIDFYLFRGQVWFLIAINYILAGLTCWIFWQCCKLLGISGEKWIAPIIIVATFSWVQYQNFTWGFQSQFFLAQLLPLAALVEISRATSDPKCHRYHYITALFLGVLSIGSMANGILTLPLLTAYYAIYHRQNRSYLTGLVLATVIFWFFYFYNYISPGHHGSLLSAVSSQPMKIIHYVLLYLGSPAYHLSGGAKYSLWVATLAGIVFVSFYAFLFIKAIAPNRSKPIVLSLILFILYIGGTALGTAGGRIVFGVEQAFASRYTTPALMAWISLLLLFIYQTRHFVKFNLHLPRVALVIGLLMLPAQFTALFAKPNDPGDQLLSGLAIALGARDQKQVNNVAPSVERAIELSGLAKDQEISFFTVSEINLAKESFGKILNLDTSNYRACDAHVKNVLPIITEDKFIRVRGWIGDLSGPHTPTHAYIIDGRNFVVGIVLINTDYLNEAMHDDYKQEALGFDGYTLAAVGAQRLYLVSQSLKCKVSIDIPQKYFSIQAFQKGTAPTVSVNQLGATVGWGVNGDPFRTNLDRVAVFGSYVNGDADKGKISLFVKDFDQVLYRSGPTGGNQSIRLLGEENTQWTLPTAENWIMLSFSLGDNRELLVEFIDDGDSWGEWSAVGLVD